MSSETVTISTAVPTTVKSEAAAFPAAHGISLAGMVRELVAHVAAHDAETLAWLDEAHR